MVSADLFVFIDQRLLEWSAPPDPVGKPTYCSVKDPENVGKSAFISVWGQKMIEISGYQRQNTDGDADKRRFPYIFGQCALG